MRYLLLPHLVAALLIAGCAASSPNLVVTPPQPHVAALGQKVIGSPVDRQLLASLVIDYINIYRSKRNLSILAYDSKVSDAAFWMSDYQAGTGQVSHVATPASMNRMGDRYRKYGGGAYACGFENAGWYPLYNSAHERNYTYDEMARYIVDGWINSPEHHENLIVKAAGDGYIGLGVSEGNHAGVDGIFSTMDIFFYLPKWADNSELSIEAEPVTKASNTTPAPAATATKKPATSSKKTSRSPKK